MRLQRSIRYITVLAILLSVSCKKDEGSGAPASPASAENPIRTWCDDNLSAAIQSFTVNAGTGGEIVGNQGSKVTFVPYAFITPGGMTVSGTVQVELVEILDFADMIRYNKQTLGDDAGTLKALKSGGELRVIATQGGTELGIVDNGATISVPGSSVDLDIRGFYGTEDANGEVIWREADTSDVVIVPDTTVFDTTGGMNWFYYVFQSDSLDWLNCDAYPSSAVASFNITVPDDHDNSNTMLWIAMPGINSVVGAYYGSSNNYISQNAPLGQSAFIVGLSEISGNYYSSFTPVTIASGITPSITFSPTTLAQFEADIDAL